MTKNIKPIKKELLIHKAYWQQETFNGAGEKFLIENIRLRPNMQLFEQGQVATGWGNFTIIYDTTYSTPLPNGQSFSVGDTFSFDFFPYVGQITAIFPQYAMDGTKVHHYEIVLK